jgi:sugar phosphate isomerase/epimerase
MPPARIPVLFSTGSLWSYGIDRCYALAAAAGFDGIELMVDQRWDSRQPDYLAPLGRAHGLPVLAVHSPFAHVPGWPDDMPGRIRASVVLAEALGAPVVVHHLPARVGMAWLRTAARFFPVPMPRNPEAPYRDWLERDYAAFQATTSIRLCIENMPAFRRFGRPISLYRWNTAAGMARFPAQTMDTTHLGTWDLDPTEALAASAERIGHVHLSDFDGREHRLPGEGRLRLDRFLAALAASGYAGAVSMEVLPEVLDAGRPDASVLARLRAGLAFIRRGLEV